MFPTSAQPFLFGLIMSGLMSFVVSGVATARAIGIPEDFVALWIAAWVPSWAVAFPTVLIVAPVSRFLVSKLIRSAP